MDFPRNIYIDSRLREQNSQSSSDFVYELTRNINLPKRCAGFITDVTIAVRWHNMNVNGRYLYFIERTKDLAQPQVALVEVPVKNYTASALAAALKTALGAASPNGYMYTVTNSNVTGKLSITVTNPADKEYDWSGTGTLETQPFLSLAGT